MSEYGKPHEQYRGENGVDHKYADMLDMPHHQSCKHPHMSLHDRAAQFAPFAALTGYEDELAETARLTEERMTADEPGMGMPDGAQEDYWE